MRKICVISGTRADYGLLYWLMREISSDPALQLQLLVTGTHLSPLHGNTEKLILKDGFAIAAKVPLPLKDNSDIGITKAVSWAIDKIGIALTRISPDMVVVLGDRYEMFAAATAAFIQKLPLAHIHGGEVTEGALDDGFRHAISKMATVHFPVTQSAQNRLIRMGEQPGRIFMFGSPGVENIKRLSLKTKNQLQLDTGIDFSHPTAMVTYHPATLEKISPQKQVTQLLSALEKTTLNIVFTMPNADAGGQVFTKTIKTFVQKHKERCFFIPSMGQINYLSSLKYAKVVIGNSSSAIIEAPCFGVPVVNIGIRQKGREFSANIFSCEIHEHAISSTIKKACSYKRRKVKGYYTAGKTSFKIKEKLKHIALSSDFLRKGFYDSEIS
jgi:UDP-N-acetylglucosamine 2-epimerase (non-hydrolysing)/GDP/UDP-N,N'-diacetylbacillosamine 2-epimerase (hydrolysing)